MNPIVFARLEGEVRPVYVSIDENCRFIAQLIEKLQPKLSLQATPLYLISVHFNDIELAPTDEVAKFLTSRTNERDQLIVKTAEPCKSRFYTNRFCLPCLAVVAGTGGTWFALLTTNAIFLQTILRFDTVLILKATSSGKLRFDMNRFCLHCLDIVAGAVHLALLLC